MSLPLQMLVELLPQDTEARVKSAQKRYNDPIREMLRQETGLRFSRADFERERTGNERRGAEVQTVPVTVVPGLPESLCWKMIEDKDRLAAVLSQWTGHLVSLHRSADVILRELPPAVRGVPGSDKIIENVNRCLPPTLGLAGGLLGGAASFDLPQWILSVNSDVLGVYEFHARRFGPPDGIEDASIKLFWGVIGLVARSLGVPIEELTAVVLAHELGHAYTHLGFDIDNRRWPSGPFADAENALAEGLAQYYTEAVCRRLERVVPGATRAYEILLQHQPPDYQSHVPWVTNATPEEVRLAMLGVRRREESTLGRFESALSAAQQNLRERQH